ncbi:MULTISPECIES: acetyl-CoA carboxylase biotin carboxyl carrier protein [unclassified Spirosoma]|uniref:acetyl-CoA carboxylase biotin carboxyl carrier protein n=1 Tax=unclassified Spirosoma TaxID=2621999 RepID=UPI00095F3B4C|nr:MULTISPECIES: acetyl-CoA carboxylase biotin carboxyl carrier protein [unclassified Spirosoma]MBN8823177.1 acetyl-CoA carboxylase biotin carboxyl carrier protein [Spirosoma sp.]OJW73259.1 MAG: acetyl-CoA carboxylase, biotin carboxyl carrier protein [Spirosoma sp. 48-14]
MTTQDIQQLIDFISQSGLDEVNIETNDLKISVKRYGSGAPAIAPVAPAIAPAAPAPIAQPQAAAPTATSAPTPVAAPKADTSNYVTIKSPMIGTFYRSSNPETPSFVEVGDSVTEGKVVCIIEAMKLFNEIESEVSGRIVKVLVENATPVEYDQPLFLVEPI